MAEPLALAKFCPTKWVGQKSQRKPILQYKKDCSSVEYITTIIFCTIEQDHSSLKHIKPVMVNGIFHERAMDLLGRIPERNW
jgi:hypothetical protein